MRIDVEEVVVSVLVGFCVMEYYLTLPHYL